MADARRAGFPACMQFSPVPAGGGWRGGGSPRDAGLIRDTLGNIVEHGFNVLYLPIDGLAEAEAAEAREQALSLGMDASFMTHGLEGFDRNHPPALSVHAPGYAAEVRKRAQAALAPLKGIGAVRWVFPFQDEPFHAVPECFDLGEDARAEFRRRYGYGMPASVAAARGDPRQWLDFLNFQSDTFRDGWRTVYGIVKEMHPRPLVVMTHDSHGPFGAGVGSDQEIAVDDVFHWGADFADVFVFDIYPYTIDYRYGEHGLLPRPRISQAHYTLSQLRNLTERYNKGLGFWVGAYGRAFFRDFMGPERQAQYWMERELAYTAIGQGADLLINGYNVPEDARHWEDYGAAMRAVQKAGEGLLSAPRVRARACFLFPRTQQLQFQEEYFNVGISFELFLRAFGELDIIHEEQVAEGGLDGYAVLVMCDVRLLPQEAARRIESFIRDGGVVMADCVPQLDAFRNPMDVLLRAFGVGRADTGRVAQDGKWVAFSARPPEMVMPPGSGAWAPPSVTTDAVHGTAFGRAYAFCVASPRKCDVADAEVLLRMRSGSPGLVFRAWGKGRAYLMGFCLQDSCFQAWKADEEEDRAQLAGLIGALFADAGVVSHVHSSNPDVEAALRANGREAYVLVINHEAADGRTTVRLSDVGFAVGGIVDVEDDAPVPFRRDGAAVVFEAVAAFGSTRLLRVAPAI